MCRKLLLVMLLSTGVLCTSCDMFSKKEKVAHSDPNGSVNEKIAYQKGEISKYRTAINMEKQKSIKSLQKRDMGEVRRSNDKVARYQRKLTEHKQALSTLEQEKNKPGA
ncbi:MAG: hypothetical protein SP4CHLAM5_10900 [Chlamydiia bacterium]|nr:hypothetical protein [Chlamydiia bacterium]MCH9618947.1 hypothetical protein [Chlamydiia bacterium]MCH9624711.1 hypothetical protein [Chlamydiia bacterium]